jgi:Mg2+/Co2+ transporter CorC
LAEVARVDVSDLPAAESVDTIGGLITMIAGRVPAKGEVVRVQTQVEFEIVEADTRRIKKLILKRVARDDPAVVDKTSARSTHRQIDPSRPL